ncbi:hypothetical protein F5Y05DRAFT_418974 [Hypoxylon sp. FL0543]|nr:hypothetical protein F5Y05DRAFT_418974 [Hypoxylon sp. FL0543]
MTSVPLLIQYLPEEGFAWWSKFWTPFLPSNILCARIRYLNGWHFYHERIRFQIPDSRREHDYNPANVAIDRWRLLVENTYEDYFPWWLTDSDNEGSAEAMIMRFDDISGEDEDEDIEMGYGHDDDDGEDIEIRDDVLVLRPQFELLSITGERSIASLGD